MIDSNSTISEIQAHVYDVSVSKGFHDKDDINSMIEAGNRLMLIVGEVAEAHEEIRNGHALTETYYPFIGHNTIVPKPEGVPSELADIVIRCMDFAETYGIDLAAAIIEKSAYNETRPHMHGKDF